MTWSARVAASRTGHSRSTMSRCESGAPSASRVSWMASMACGSRAETRSLIALIIWSVKPFMVELLRRCPPLVGGCAPNPVSAPGQSRDDASRPDGRGIPERAQRVRICRESRPGLPLTARPRRGGVRTRVRGHSETPNRAMQPAHRRQGHPRPVPARATRPERCPQTPEPADRAQAADNWTRAGSEDRFSGARP
ncbi:Hypothetical protein PFR_JS25-2_42 [Propionibacterium freudenreichii]|nr:Hypothetical protein PFR_JS25-2_42 [Propionibacterium freudenreichii]